MLVFRETRSLSEIDFELSTERAQVFRESLEYFLTAGGRLVGWAHEQTISHVRPESASSASALAAGLAPGRASGTVRGGRGGHVRPVGHLCEVRAPRRAGIGGVPSGADGAVADLWVLHGVGEFAADGAGDV